MKSLVLYDSNFGNTKIIAEKVAAMRGKGTRLIHVSDVTDDDLKGTELLIVGAPINGWRPSEKMKTFLEGLESGQLKGMKAAAFDTRMKVWYAGDGVKKMITCLKNAGAEVVAQPQWFYVQGKDGPLMVGEIDRAGSWAKTL